MACTVHGSCKNANVLVITSLQPFCQISYCSFTSASFVLHAKPCIHLAVIRASRKAMYSPRCHSCRTQSHAFNSLSFVPHSKPCIHLAVIRASHKAMHSPRCHSFRTQSHAFTSAIIRSEHTLPTGASNASMKRSTTEWLLTHGAVGLMNEILHANEKVRLTPRGRGVNNTANNVTLA